MLTLLLQVAERALYYWNNEYIVNLIGENIQVILPIVFSALYHNSKTHWNRCVRHIAEPGQGTDPLRRQIHNLAYNALKLLMDINPQLFEECTNHLKEQRMNEQAMQQAREERWRRLRDSAMENRDSTAPIPQSLLGEIVPQGTYRAEEVPYDVSVDDVAGYRGDEQIVDSIAAEDDMQMQMPIESDDAATDMVSTSRHHRSHLSLLTRCPHTECTTCTVSERCSAATHSTEVNHPDRCSNLTRACTTPQVRGVGTLLTLPHH